MNEQERQMMPDNLERGLSLLRKHRAEITFSEGVYSVPDGSETFLVTATPGGGAACSCGAVCGPQEEHGTICEHILGGKATRRRESRRARGLGTSESLAVSSTRVGTSGPWTHRVCEACLRRRCMPASEVFCRRYAPGGGPRSWRLSRLRQTRLRARVSPELLAVRAGVGVDTILRAERTNHRVHTATAASIAAALGVQVSALVNETEPCEVERSRR